MAVRLGWRHYWLIKHTASRTIAHITTRSFRQKTRARYMMSGCDTHDRAAIILTRRLKELCLAKPRPRSAMEPERFLLSVKGSRGPNRPAVVHAAHKPLKSWMGQNVKSPH